jgi:threonine/homoserine/homoserine lactone efflux protein
MPPAFAEFLAAAVIMELTPGPNMTWLALLAARRGRMAGLQAVAGIAAGLTVLAILSAAGIATLISAYPTIYDVLRWAGVIFILYLALEAWQGEEAGESANGRSRHFVRGFVVNMLNPKAAAVFLVVIPGFASQIDGRPIMLMTAIYLAIATLAHSLIVIFAGAFTRTLADPARETIVRRIFALLLVAIALWFAVSTGQSRT